MSYLLGMCACAISLYLGLLAIGQPPQNFFDEVAMAVVLGGTLAVGVVVLPWKKVATIRSSIFGVLKPFSRSHRFLVRECLDFVRDTRAGSAIVRTKGYCGQILEDGKELMELGFDAGEIEEIVGDRIERNLETINAVAAAFKGLAKYPPAFGLIGTVFGLVELMSAITEGLEPAQTGSRMAIALVATLYGLLMSNFLIAPLGEALVKRAKDEQESFQICLDAVVMAAKRTSLLKAQEQLNSHVEVHQRVDYIKNAIDHEERKLVA